MILLRNILWIVDTIIAIYGLFMLIFNGYVKIINNENNKILKRNREREKIKKEDFPRLQSLKTKIAVCTKLI